MRERRLHPSKALLAAAESRSRALQGRFPGIFTDAGAVDMRALVAAKVEIVGGLRQDKHIGLADEYGFDLLEGNARFVAGPALDVDGRRIEASYYLVATGADPDVPDIPGLADSGYLTSTTAMQLDDLSSSMVVIGGGYVAMEQAHLFAHLGTEVTMLVRSTLARGAEPGVGETVREAFEADGIAVHEGIVPDRVARDGRDGRDVVAFADGRELRAEHLLVATGRRPRTSGLGLEDVGVRLGDGGAVVVDADLSTANPRVWAAGDVTGHPQFVYVAAKHGGSVVENAFDGADRRSDYSGLPRITFTNPTIASAGHRSAGAGAGHRLHVSHAVVGARAARSSAATPGARQGRRRARQHASACRSRRLGGPSSSSRRSCAMVGWRHRHAAGESRAPAPVDAAGGCGRVGVGGLRVCVLCVDVCAKTLWRAVVLGDRGV